MKQKRAIRYLRISTDRQSNFSIEGQESQTRYWCERNDVEIVDTFTDNGYSARNFDRPDMMRLYEFIAKNHKSVDYLVVNAFDRFSRQAGEAIVAITELQKKFQIKVVSVSEGLTFDADDPGSFFFAGMMLLKGQDEIIRNKSRIKLGIHTAKKKEGRYLGAAPLGYTNARDERNVPIIIINEVTAPIVRYVYQAYLNGDTIKSIREHARTMGYTCTSNSHLQRMLCNPAYTGLLHVDKYNDSPEELVEAIHPAIINRTTWYAVQEKLSRRKTQPVRVIRDDFELRGVLRCHCGLPLTGAPSRGRSGNYFNYYKCKIIGHNNINANRLHASFQGILKQLHITFEQKQQLIETAQQLLQVRLKDNYNLLKHRKRELKEAETMLRSVEEKFLKDQMSLTAYERWQEFLNKKITILQGQVNSMVQKNDAVLDAYATNQPILYNIRQAYNVASTVQKQQMIRLLFDSQLYYEDGKLKTTYLMPELMHNLDALQNENLLTVDKKKNMRAA